MHPVKQTSLLLSPSTFSSQLSQSETPIILTSNLALAIRDNVAPVPFDLGNAGLFVCLFVGSRTPEAVEASPY